MSSCCHCQTTPVKPQEKIRPAREWMRMGLAALVAAQSMIFSLAINLSPPSGTTRMILHGALALSAIFVFVLLGGPILRAACQPRIVMEQLFLAGILGAFFASVYCSVTGVGHVYYEVVAVLLTIYTFGRVLGERRRKFALDAAAEIGREFDPGRSIEKGDVVRVEAGGAITVDGVIVEGTALVRETALTGEPFPVVKRPGDSVLAGSWSLDGALAIANAGGERQLDKLLGAVREARNRPSRLQRESDRIVRIFLPLVLGIALIVFGLGGIKGDWIQATFNALAVILVACPCAMGLATPIGIWSALTQLARHGLISHSSDLVEKLGKVNTVVFDKTGTLGEEAMQLVDFVTSVDREGLLRAVSALQRASEHPIAAAFPRMENAPFISEIELLPGIGLRGLVEGHRLEIGNAQLATDAEIAPLRSSLRDDSHLVVIRRDGVLVGLASLREKMRDTSQQALRELRAMGIECLILTGDVAASEFANAETGMSSTQKRGRIRELKRGGANILFVGDGINDAPAMAESDAALAIATGSALAKESADGEILGGNLLAVPMAIACCRRARQVIRGNLYFAAGYNLIGISLAATGVLHPVAAALIMLASSFTVSWRAMGCVGALVPSAQPNKRRLAQAPLHEPALA